MSRTTRQTRRKLISKCVYFEFDFVAKACQPGGQACFSRALKQICVLAQGVFETRSEASSRAKQSDSMHVATGCVWTFVTLSQLGRIPCQRIAAGQSNYGLQQRRQCCFQVLSSLQLAFPSCTDMVCHRHNPRPPAQLCPLVACPAQPLCSAATVDLWVFLAAPTNNKS